MCGSYGGGCSNIEPEVAKEKTPVWKLSDDKKHIIFYGVKSKQAQCEGSTEWCREHCYLNTLPIKKEIKPAYRMEYFDPNNLHELIKEDFSAAEYATFFGSGTIGAYDNSECVGNFPYDTVEDTIRLLCHSFPRKVFRFFLRQKIDDVCEKNPMTPMPPENAIIVFSIDKSTKIDDVNWAIESELVHLVAVVDHPDNIMMIEYIKKRINKSISCAECTGYACFEQKEKTLVLYNYQESGDQEIQA